MNEREEGYYRVMLYSPNNSKGFRWEIAYYSSNKSWFITGEEYPVPEEEISEIIEQRLDPMPGEDEEEAFKAGWLARNAFTTSDLSDSANEALIYQDYLTWVKTREKNT